MGKERTLLPGETVKKRRIRRDGQGVILQSTEEKMRGGGGKNRMHEENTFWLYEVIRNLFTIQC